jgi:hypothetical protein
VLVKDRWHIWSLWTKTRPRSTVVIISRPGGVDPRVRCQRWNMVTAAEGANHLAGQLGNDTFLMLLPTLRTLYGPSETSHHHFPFAFSDSPWLPLKPRACKAANFVRNLAMSRSSSSRPAPLWKSAGGGF